ncbi:MAG: sugar phosphate nucleotidyltransferase [Vicinamibacterales bacterium]
MKAILLAGGKGTRLRPLTLHTPKPIVPIFNRAFLQYQIDLLKSVPEIDEVILSLNYQPRRIEELFGDGAGTGLKIRYVVEPNPLGTGGAIRFAAQGVDDSIVVFNGDVLTTVDLNGLIALHRSRRALATIVLTPVDNPAAYGLVETDREGNVRRFLEKPDPTDITCNTINAGIYVLEPSTFDRIPKDVSYSIERAYFPSLVERNETFVAHVDTGYWIDIGTPQKYMQVHRDVMDGRCRVPPFASNGASVQCAESAMIEAGADLQGPCYVDDGAVIKAGARILPYSVVGKQVHIEEGATIAGSVIWANSWIGRDSTVTDALIGRNCSIGRNSSVRAGSVLGDKTVLTDYTRL